MAKPSSLHLCSRRQGCDTTTGQLRGLGNLTSPGPRAGSTALAPQTNFLWSEVAAGLREERDQCSLFSAERPPGPVEGAKDQLYLCLALALPGATGKWPGNGAHHGKAPFPHHLHPMFPALEHGEPHISYRLNRVISTLPSPSHPFYCLTLSPSTWRGRLAQEVEPGATSASPNSASPRASPQGADGAVSQLSAFHLSWAGAPRSLQEGL